MRNWPLCIPAGRAAIDRPGPEAERSLDASFDRTPKKCYAYCTDGDGNQNLHQSPVGSSFYSSIFPATRQGQAADAVTALAVAHRRRPPSLEILCVPPLRAFTEKIEHCLENLLFSCPVQKSILSATPLLKDANVGDFLHIASARLVHTPLSLYLETGNRLFR